MENKEGHEHLDLRDSVFDKRPDMMKLRLLKLPKPGDGDEKSFDTAERIGRLYEKIGGELLQDSYGDKVEIKATDNSYQVIDTNVDILQEWLRGSGKRPVTWRTLIQVLDKCGRSELAQDMRKALLYGNND